MKRRVSKKDYGKEYFELQLWASKEAREWAETRVREVLSFAEPSERDVIADVGCGLGTFVIECAKRGSLVYGVDFSRVGLAMAKRLSKEAGVSHKVNFINSPAETIAMKKDTVDKVICADLVEHLYPKQYDALLEELRRIIKKNGYVIIYTPSPGIITKLPKPIKELGRIFLRIPKPKKYKLEQTRQKFEHLHVDLKSSRFLKNTLQERGFRVERAMHTGTGFSKLERMPIIQDFLDGHTLIKAKVLK